MKLILIILFFISFNSISQVDSIFVNFEGPFKIYEFKEKVDSSNCHHRELILFYGSKDSTCAVLIENCLGLADSKISERFVEYTVVNDTLTLRYISLHRISIHDPFRFFESIYLMKKNKLIPIDDKILLKKKTFKLIKLKQKKTTANKI